MSKSRFNLRRYLVMEARIWNTVMSGSVRNCVDWFFLILPEILNCQNEAKKKLRTCESWTISFSPVSNLFDWSERLTGGWIDSTLIGWLFGSQLLLFDRYVYWLLKLLLKLILPILCINNRKCTLQMHIAHRTCTLHVHQPHSSISHPDGQRRVPSCWGPSEYSWRWLYAMWQGKSRRVFFSRVHATL